MISHLYQLLARFAALFRRRKLDRELEEEVATHFELLTAEYVARGMDPAAARRHVARWLGSRQELLRS